MKICVIDYSMLRHVATSAVKKYQDQNAAFGHLSCIAQKMSEILYSLKTIHKPDSWVFAMDSKPYWRHDVMRSFYRENTRFLAYEDEIYWEAHGCLYKNEDGVAKKCTKKEAKPVLETNVPAWGEWDENAENWPIFTYKGTRKAQDYTWLDCDPSAYFEFIDKLPYLYAKLLNKAIVVKHEGCEADDIAGVVCKRANDRGNEVLLISGDSDWAQLSAYYPLVEFNNPYRDQVYTYADREEVIKKTRAKIIGGDAGDGIKGCPLEGSWGPLGETKAKAIEESGDLSAVDPKYLAHNKELVRLHPDVFPFDIVLKIESEIKAMKRSDQEVTWESLNLTPARMRELELESKAASLWEMVTEK